MEIIVYGLFGLLLLGVVVAFLYLFVGEFVGAIGILAHTALPMARKDRVLLEQWSVYHGRLGPAERKEFARRVKEFIYDKHWVGKDIRLTREMRVRVSAIAVQVTYGLGDLLLIHFGNIVIHPDAFHDRLSGAKFKGATYLRRGTIMLSWKHFTEGDADHTDALHLGLHEFAHALWLEHAVPNEEDDFFDQAALADWSRLARVEMAMINAGESRLFRRYAGTNEAEFFACAVEYFFERTADFKEKMPAEYAVMCRLLKQDPAGNTIVQGA